MRSYSSSLAFNSAHVLMLRKKIKPHGINPQEKGTKAKSISNKVLTVIREAESRAQQCLSRVGEGTGTALCAWSLHVQACLHKKVQHTLMLV